MKMTRGSAGWIAALAICAGGVCMADVQPMLKQVVMLPADDVLNVRAGAGAGFDDIGDLPPGAFVRVVAYVADGKWAQIEWDHGAVGYVAARYLVDPARMGPPADIGPYIVTGIAADDPDGGLVLRADPRRNGERLDVIARDGAVQVLDKTDDGTWARVVWRGKEGWASARYLMPLPFVDTQIAPEAGAYMVVDVTPRDVLNVRAAPAPDAQIVGEFAPFERIYALEILGNGWARVGIPEGAGFVNARYLQAVTIPRGHSGFPLDIICSGNEPFWSVDFHADQSVWMTTPEVPRHQIGRLEMVMPMANDIAFPYVFNAGKVSGSVSRALCEDDMSGGQSPYHITMRFREGHGDMILRGCCTLRPTR